MESRIPEYFHEMDNGSSMEDFMDDIGEAVTGDASGVIITLDVSPGSRKDKFPAGYNEWRKSVQCHISAQPVGGKANKAIIALIADVFSIPKRQISIQGGMTSSQKRVRIEGADRDEIIDTLRHHLMQE